MYILKTSVTNVYYCCVLSIVGMFISIKASLVLSFYVCCVVQPPVCLTGGDSEGGAEDGAAATLGAAAAHEVQPEA